MSITLTELFQKTKHLYSHVDIVINNAGVPETFGMRKVIDIDLVCIDSFAKNNILK